MGQEDYSRGSEWRKWDLHVHSPASYDYSGTWPEFEKQITNADCDVIGINDYFTVDGYKRIKERINSGDLNIGNKTILPVVEFRMTETIQNKNTKTNSVTHFNFHIIFSEKVSVLEIENLIKSLKYNDTKISSDYDDKEKLRDKKISLWGLIKELDEDVKFKAKYLLWLSYDEYGGIDEINPEADGWIKGKYIREANILGSANQKQIDFFLWKSENKKNGEPKFSQGQFKKWFRTKKPCIKGSDSHSSKYPIGKLKDKNSNPIDKFCWIKGDPCFEGLKQVVFEPENRVLIGERPEILNRINADKTNYIDSLEIKKKQNYKGEHGLWFQNIKLEFNKELIAIIGNKGSGKSAVADILGLLGNTYNAGEKNLYFSFLNDKKFRQRGFAENFSAKIEWLDSTERKLSLSDEMDLTDVEKVRYIPQNYFEKLTNDLQETDDLKGTDFESTLKNVIFSHMPNHKKLGKKSFFELESYRDQNINKDIDLVRKKISSFSDEIIDLENKWHPDYKKEVENLLKEKEKEYNEHKKIRPKPVKKPSEEKEPHIQKKVNKINSLDNDLANIESIIDSNEKDLTILNNEIEELSQILKDIDRIENQVLDFIDVNKERLKKYDLELEKVFALNVNKKLIADKIKSKKKSLKKVDLLLLSEKQISDLSQKENDRKQIISKSLIVKKEKIKNEIEKFKKDLTKQQKKYQDYKEKLKKWQEKEKEIKGSQHTSNTLEYYKAEIKFIDEKLYKKVVEKRGLRIKESVEILKMKKEIIELYNSFKKAIDNEMEKDSEFLEKFNMKIDVSLKLTDNFPKKFLSYIQKNKAGTFYGKTEGQKALKKITEYKNFLEEKDIRLFLEEVIEALEIDKRENFSNTKRYIKEQINELNEFYNYLFSLNYLEPIYELKYEDKKLAQLSPGEKGALLLVFYLMIDKEDIPLIIDQPEDNLDNQSVFKILTHFIRIAKKRRQIFIVTHNPNLAVCADAEQIIYVNLDKNNYKFSYISGSIENIDINNKIVDILEGTMPAFDKRKLKYIGSKN